MLDIIEILRDLAFPARDLSDYQLDLEDDTQSFPICFPKFPIKRNEVKDHIVRKNSLETSSLQSVSSSEKVTLEKSPQSLSSAATQLSGPSISSSTPLKPVLETTTTSSFGSEVSSYGIAQAPNSSANRLFPLQRDPNSSLLQHPTKNLCFSHSSVRNNQHIPSWMPSFPNQRTYKETKVVEVPILSEADSKILYSKRKRQAESGL